VKASKSAFPLVSGGFLAACKGAYRVVDVMTDFVKQDAAQENVSRKRQSPTYRRLAGKDVVDHE